MHINMTKLEKVRSVVWHHMTSDRRERKQGLGVLNSFV